MIEVSRLDGSAFWINPHIFREKNYSGMKDTQDIQVTPNQNSQIPENAEEIIDKLPEKNSASDVAMLESGE